MCVVIMFRCFRLIAIACLALVAACGSPFAFPPDVPTDSPPIVSRVEPAEGSPGDMVTIYGFGFSFTVANNIVIFGDAASVATSYRLLDSPTSTEIEAIEAPVPNEAPEGEVPVVVVVYENVSNADVLFTVTP
jgi:hypothetical protein